jgi:cytochrome c nitrite reductase small subunit
VLVRAGEPEPSFNFDRVDYLGSRFLAGLLVLGIIAVLYSMIRYHGRTTNAWSWVLLGASGLVIPAVSLSFGTILVFERAEKPDFCASCHVAMIGHVNDMHDPNSKSLAALHYKNRYIPANQCYECHTSYGINGTVEAKLSGTIDLYKYYTRTFHKPLKMRSPYPNGDCLKCHAQSAKWLNQHGDFKDTLFKGEMHCMECHGAWNPAHTVKD